MGKPFPIKPGQCRWEGDPSIRIINGVYSEPAVTGDEAQTTPGHTASNLHLTAADKTPTAQTTKATITLIFLSGDAERCISTTGSVQVLSVVLTGT
ncbi:hypothetical protein NQZ68_003729 [Dissostichus eleginoides]|nr:hypothetical protein NQZ68_003729 [Dissostichus eleginoides]